MVDAELARAVRLEAMKLLQRTVVQVRVLEVSETEALLIEIDENLQRAELTALERSYHLAERKKVWLALHPETGHGKTPGNKGRGKGKAPSGIKEATMASLIPDSNGNPPKAFHKDAAEKTGESETSVKRYTRIGEKLSGQARKLLQDTPAANKVVELTKIAVTSQKPWEAAQLIARAVRIL